MVAVFDTVTSSVGKLVVGSLQVVELVRGRSIGTVEARVNLTGAVCSL